MFEPKGGASLSKGFGVIHRFSEDLDIRIEPPDDFDVKAGRNQSGMVSMKIKQGFR